MKYQTPDVVQTDTTVLGQFTPMEARCVASQADLAVGDDVTVVYIATVQDGKVIPLGIPYIVKSENFQEYVDRLIEIIEAKRSTVGKAPEEAIPTSEIQPPSMEKPA